LHWRHDYADLLPLGEAIAISVLKLNEITYKWNESFAGFSSMVSVRTDIDSAKTTIVFQAMPAVKQD